MTAPVSPEAFLGTLPLTGKTLPSPINVEAGQIVQVKVVFTFS
jgi:hypothetical protein